MVATESKLDRTNRFWFLYPIFLFKNIKETICLFFTVCVLMSCSLADDQDFMEEFLKREYSLAKPYRGLGFSSSSQWDLMGTAMVTPDHVRLTPDLQSRQGAVWSRLNEPFISTEQVLFHRVHHVAPACFYGSPKWKTQTMALENTMHEMPFFLRDWELKVHFKIHGQGKKNFNGDGLAIWLTKDRMQNGPVFGNMNQFVGLGIFVDTYPNADKSHDRTFPYVSVMLGNGTLSYDHNRDGRPTELGGCTAMARNAIYDTFLLVRYSRNRLTLMVDVDGKQEWKDCADITGLHLPTGYFFGASSVTGDLSDNHDIISMKLYQLTVERTIEEEEEEVTIPSVDNMEHFQVEVQDEGMSGVQFFFTLLFSILGLGVLAVVGLMVYGRWKENRRKRFY